MKKFVLTVLTVLTGGALQALPVMNPADASLYTNNFWFGDSCGDSCCDPCDPCSNWCDWFDIRLGFYGDYVFNRHLETKGNINTDQGGDIQDTLISTNAGLVVLNICEWLDVFATVGVSNFHIKTEDSVLGAPAPVMSEWGFSPSMSYSGGLRATLWNCDCFYIGAEGQYFYSRTKLDYFLPYSSGVLTYFNDDRRSDYQEWQVGIGATYTFINCADFMFAPYMAIKVAGVNWNQTKDYTVDSVQRRYQTLQNKKVVGWALGMSAILCNLIGVTVEGRWADEKAVHVNGQLSF